MRQIRKHTYRRRIREQAITFHGFSVEPPDLTAVVELLRDIEAALTGTGRPTSKGRRATGADA
jgi:hypothetical protein